jgi:hypothetical protein
MTGAFDDSQASYPYYVAKMTTLLLLCENRDAPNQIEDTTQEQLQQALEDCLPSGQNSAFRGTPESLGTALQFVHCTKAPGQESKWEIKPSLCSVPLALS